MDELYGRSDHNLAKRRKVLPRQTQSITAVATSNSGTSDATATGTSSNDIGATVRILLPRCMLFMYVHAFLCIVAQCSFGGNNFICVCRWTYRQTEPAGFVR